MKASSLFLSLPLALTASAHSDASHEAVVLENVVVSAAPFERDQARLAAATSVLAGEALSLSLQHTLGDTLGTLPGISATGFGPGASRPVIRGLEGDRIRVLSNSLGTVDASVISPDHAVAIDPLLVERVEVIRGPAALLYGGNAIGGVVNVLDHRIHHRTLDAPFSARVESRLGTADDGWSNAAVLEGAVGAVSWHLDGYSRETEDVEIPGHAFSSRMLAEAMEERLEHGEPLDFAHGFLPNSATRTDGGAAGLSYAGGRGFVGLSYSGHNTLYGIPPGAHAHGEEHDEHTDGAEDDHGDNPEGEEGVRIDLRQRRVDLQGELTDPLPGFAKAKLKVGLVRYRHLELEGDEIGTTFQNRGYDSRLELVQERRGSWEGAVGAQLGRSRFAAAGEEAFLPSSTTRDLGLFTFQELGAGSLTYQAGARLDRRNVQVDDAAGTRVRDNAFSVSGGAIWEISPVWSLAGTLARNERAPNVQERFADGPHAGTGTYEIGDAGLRNERSLSAEAVLRRRAGRVTGELTVFTHQFDGYIFPEATGEEDAEHGLPVHRHVQRDTRFSGLELETIVHLHASTRHTLDLRLTGDLVRARQRDGGPSLPRITPRRGSVGVEYRSGGFHAGVSLLGVERARHLAPDETPTPGYVWWNAHGGYSFRAGRAEVRLFVRGENLSDETARNHVSFLKDIAPLPGRSVTAGVQLRW